MAFLDSVRNGFTSAVDTVSSVTQTIVEKNRQNAQLNRLRTIMKNECEMINRAYITLGKKYYDNKVNGRSEACENEQALFNIIENSKAQIKKARERYLQIIESQTVEITKKYDIEDLEDITVACSNEDEYEGSPFVPDEVAAEEDIDITPEVTEEPEEPAETDEEVASDDSF
ncbi:MAG: hypothetical protein J1E41_04815 [Ruminococcus sp.]|nr:hypothetical protein [Ruminococcus sp.]